MPTVRIYACGGAATNIAAQIPLKKKEGHADIVVTYCDLSKSDIKYNKIPDSSIFTAADDKDGSGKKRNENSRIIEDSIPALLLEHPPADINIVLFSGSGGTGSVYGPFIISELMCRGNCYLAMMVSTSESSVAASNSLNTLKSLDGVARVRKYPAVVSFFNNRDRLDRGVDEAVLNVIQAISLLFSGSHHRLDSKDLANWNRFENIVNAHNTVALLRIITEEEIEAKAASIKFPVSIASLYKSEESISFPGTPDYSCAGYNDALPTTIHFVISYESVDSIAGSLNEVHRTIAESSRARTKLSNILTPNDNVDESGLCF